MCTNIVQWPILLHDEKKKPITLKFNSVFVKQKQQRIRKDTKKQLNNPSWEATREWHARADAFSGGSPLEMESLLDGNHLMTFQSLVFLGLYPMIWAWDYLPPEVVHPVIAQ